MQGGFHNFKADGSTDIAQTIQFANNSTLVFQWNEVYDPIPPTRSARRSSRA
jgi:hypothetical protein